jgi:hypothetical protein
MLNVVLLSFVNRYSGCHFVILGVISLFWVSSGTLSVIIQSITIQFQNTIRLNVVLQRVVIQSVLSRVSLAECDFPKCHHPECRGATLTTTMQTFYCTNKSTKVPENEFTKLLTIIIRSY